MAARSKDKKMLNLERFRFANLFLLRMGLKKKLLFKSSDYKKGNNKRIVSGLTYFMECCKKVRQN